MDLTQIQKEEVACTSCPRLISYVRKVAEVKTTRFRDWDYWGKPVPSWGDPRARLVIIGLAPAAHGGNRTGRVFTGDRSGEWLFRALYEVGLASKPESESRNDGLEVKDVFITSVIHCAPPENKPARDEILNCSRFLRAEFLSLSEAKVYLGLGVLAFNELCRLMGLSLEFRHGAFYSVKGKWVAASYHPSARNTLTGKLTWEMWMGVFRKIREILGST